MRKYCIIISACLLLLSLASADYVYITNIGVPGIGETNQNYTALRTVILNLEFMGSAINCRYINHDNNTDKPLDSDLNWSYPEPCVSLKYWLLSENDGNKTVYYQINYSGTLNTFNDSIYYYHNGTGLDITPPSAPLIIDGDYTNNNDSVSISWEEASDYESEILNIPLIYNYTLYDGTDSLASGTTLSTSFTASGLGREHGDNLTVNITVINSGGLKNSSLSDGLVIDLVPPDNIVIQTQKFKNISTGDWQDIPGGDCINTLDLNFSWYADDADSYISGYSYLLTSDSTKNPDQIPEGLIGQLECETFHLFEDIGSASYYFKVRARDAATNWGEIKNFSFCVDNSPPHWLRLISSNFDPKSKKITFIWTASSDEQSGILNYMINITDPNNNVLSYETSGTSYELSVTESGDYTAIVGARNGADIWRWSTEGDSTTDLTPPGVYVITNGVLITDNPILMIKTDEKSVCEYSFDNSVYYRFLYTNSTYHETKTSAPQGANLVYLNCTDMSRNSNNSVTMSFTVNTTTTIDSIWVPDTLSEYQGILISVLVNVTDTDSVKLGGVVLDQFDVEIDDADIEFSIFDQGNGHYNLSFNIPSELGTHGLIVKTRNRESNELDLTVLPLRLSVDYRESQINSPTRTEQTVYGSTTSDIGLATEDTNADFDYGSGYLNLSSDYTKNVFIFNTPSFTNIIRKDRYLENSEFLDLTTPSFGYAYTDSYYLRLILYYKDISLLLDNPFGLSRRRQDIMLQKTFTGAKRTVIISKMVS